MEISGNVFDVVATGGDPYLGGANIDGAHRRVDPGQHQEEARPRPDVGAPPPAERSGPPPSRRSASCRDAAPVDLQIPLSVGTKEKKAKLGLLRLHLATVEDLAQDIVGRVLGYRSAARSAIAAFKRRTSTTSSSSAAQRGMPLLREQVEQLFGKAALANLPPEEVVALGAALLADSLRRDHDSRHDVVEASIGIALADGRYMRIIEKNSKLPITRRVMIPDGARPTALPRSRPLSRRRRRHHRCHVSRYGGLPERGLRQSGRSEGHRRHGDGCRQDAEASARRKKDETTSSSSSKRWDTRSVRKTIRHSCR